MKTDGRRMLNLGNRVLEWRFIQLQFDGAAIGWIGQMNRASSLFRTKDRLFHTGLS